MNLVDTITGPLRVALSLFGRPATYVVGDDELPQAALLAYVRGLRAEDLFASAQQQDIVAVIDAGVFAQAFPGRVSPMRFDRLRVGVRSYAVESWRGSPNDAAPVFYKLLLRGGQQ